MARRDIFPFLTSFFAFLAVYSTAVFAANVPDCGTGGWYYNSMNNSCIKCDWGFTSSDHNSTDEKQCYYKIGSSAPPRYLNYSNFRDCTPGTYLPKNATQCTDCPDGSWCPGWSGWTHFEITKNRGLNSCPGKYKHSKPKATNVTDCYKSIIGIRKYFECGDGNYVEGDECKACPSGFKYTHNHKTGTKIEDCTDGNGRYYNEITCPQGKYLPKGKKACENCLSKSDGYFCNGGSHLRFSEKYDQGIRRCAPGYVANPGDWGCKSEGEQITCGAGTYLPKGTTRCQSFCLYHYACAGGSFAYNEDEDQGIVYCQNGSNEDRTQCIGENSGGGTSPQQCVAGKYYDAEGDACWDCPANFPESAPGLDGIDKCYKIDANGNTVYYSVNNPSGGGQTQCESGQYYTSNTCKDCPTGFGASDANATKKEQCYTVVGGAKLYYKSVKCDPGTYLKQSSGACSSCADGYVCYGGTYWTSTTKDQGLKTCSGGKIPNANQTGCTYEENYGTVVSCNPGEYLPAGLGRCRKCSNKAQYCPGGALTSSTTDQGLVDCPYGATANSGFTSCNFTLSQIKLKFGPKGKSTTFSNQCWTLTNIKDYARCVLRYTGPIASSGGSIKVEKETIQMQQNAPDLK